MFSYWFLKIDDHTVKTYVEIKQICKLDVSFITVMQQKQYICSIYLNYNMYNV